MNQLDIIYEDEHVLVVYKPSGVAVQTKRMGQKDMESVIKNYLAKDGRPPYLGIIHRLDQPVEGVLVFAKNQKAAAELSRQAASKDGMGKEYLAVVCLKENSDKPDIPDKGTLKNWLLKDGKTNTSRVVNKGAKDAKEAILEYEILHKNTEQGIALVKVLLKTGRHHQIRVQMAHAGMPLYGDTKYNPMPQNKMVALCAHRLTFEHPKTKKKLTFSREPENPAFTELLAK